MKFSIFVVAVIALGIFIFWKDVKGTTKRVKQSFTENSNKEEKNKGQSELSTEIKIIEKWDLPKELLEISGLAYVDDSRFACVQDEAGIIFIYNRITNQIEKEIQFASPGDYEGLTLNGNTAYIVRSDGRLFEVDMNIGKSSTKEYSTSLTLQNNVEGLCYDKKNNRLLLAIKGAETHTKDYKGVYAFDLGTRTFKKDPVLKINVNTEVLNGKKSKKNKNMNPSAIGIHPITNEYYITDGTKSGLLILDKEGNIKTILNLGKSFAQPEGITFSPKGEIFISNEGTKQPGNIVKVSVE